MKSEEYLSQQWCLIFFRFKEGGWSFKVLGFFFRGGIPWYAPILQTVPSDVNRVILAGVPEFIFLIINSPLWMPHLAAQYSTWRLLIIGYMRSSLGLFLFLFLFCFFVAFNAILFFFEIYFSRLRRKLRYGNCKKRRTVSFILEILSVALESFPRDKALKIDLWIKLEGLQLMQTLCDMF